MLAEGAGAVLIGVAVFVGDCWVAGVMRWRVLCH